jgi:hypothetical protein
LGTYAPIVLIYLFFVLDWKLIYGIRMITEDVTTSSKEFIR